MQYVDLCFRLAQLSGVEASSKVSMLMANSSLRCFVDENHAWIQRHMPFNGDIDTPTPRTMQILLIPPALSTFFPVHQ